MTSAAPSPAGDGQQVVLVVDQGTTNTKALLVEQSGAVVATASRAVPVTFPQPAWVEQDPEAIWAATAEAARAVLAGNEHRMLVGLALSTQRESAVAWSASTGEALGPVLGWQDGRTAQRCAGWAAEHGALVSARTGLDVDPMFSAPKMRWLLDRALERGVPADDVRLGTVDSWLLHRLTGRHATEAGNASRTLLLGLSSLAWDDDLLEVFGIPRTSLPEVIASDGEYGETRADGPLPAGVPVLAVMADSHAALFAQGCRKPGEVKATYGTGSSVMTPYDGRPGSAPAGLSATLAWLTADGPTYALEGNIIASGAAIETVARLVGAHGGAELTQLASEVDSSGGVVCVPAFAGLGAPYWDREAQGLLVGLTGGTTRAQLARAALDAVAHQVTDVVLAMEDAGVALPELCADGGATSSRLLMQTQADLLGRPVRVTPTAEASALGAALLAWERLSGTPAPERHDHAEGTATYVPAIDDARRSAERAAWAAAVSRSRGHAVPASQTTSTTTKES